MKPYIIDFTKLSHGAAIGIAKRVFGFIDNAEAEAFVASAQGKVSGDVIEDDSPLEDEDAIPE